MTLDKRTLRYILLTSILLLVRDVSPEDSPIRIGNHINSWLEQIYPLDAPGAAIFVRAKEATILRKGYGLASLRGRVPVTPTTAFRVGSITKQFTAAGILLLVGDNRLSLDMPIGSFFPTLKNRGITIRHLLTHTSGLRNFTQGPDYPRWARAGVSKQQIVQFLEKNAQEFVPGTKWAYCDSGYFLLGLIIEKTSGMPYEVFVTKRIFSPLDMVHSYFETFSKATDQQARGYRTNGETFEESPPMNLSLAYSAGSLVTTIDDLARWDAALYDSRLLRCDLLRLSFFPFTLASGRSTSYGFGWLMHRFYGEVLAEHGGRITGFECHILRIHRKRLFVAVLTNTQDRTPSPDFVATKIAMLILKLPSDPAPKQIPEWLRRELQGSYLVTTRGVRCVALEGTRLYFADPWGKKREMLASDDLDYFFLYSFNRVRFVTSPLGGISGLIFYGKYGDAVFGAKIQKSPDLCQVPGVRKASPQTPLPSPHSPPEEGRPHPEHLRKRASA